MACRLCHLRGFGGRSCFDCQEELEKEDDPSRDESAQHEGGISIGAFRILIFEQS